jgi:ABC-type transporter Mla subunit MlaD
MHIKTYLFSVLLGSFIACNAMTHYKRVYDSTDDIRELVEHTFLAHIADPDPDQLLKPKDLTQANDSILKFVEKKNKTLGIKNDDIDKIAKRFHSTLKELAQQVAILEGSLNSLDRLKTNAPSIINRLSAIHDQYASIQDTIDSLLAKKISLITASGKNLLKMLNYACEENRMFIAKLKQMIRNTLE